VLAVTLQQSEKVLVRPARSKFIHAVDVIDIVTPTLSHYKCAKVAIKSGKHVFIENPFQTPLKKRKKLLL
jgi:predicted dehydrogenase